MARLRALPWNRPARASIVQLLARPVHAVLLHGAAGIGKLDLALDTAEWLLCERRPRGENACGQCAGCVLVAAASHPDLRIVRPDALSQSEAATSDDGGSADGAGTEAGGRASREIRIEQVRDLADWIVLTTHRGGVRVIVLEPAESMNAPSCNALLKVLEEPPEGTVFLLVSHRIDHTLPTVRSRCALLRVPLPPAVPAIAWLQERGVEQARQRLIEAGGSPLLAAQVGHDALTPELRGRLLGLLRKGAELTPAEVVAMVPREAPIAGSVALFQRWGWDFLAFQMAGTVRYHPDEVAAFQGLAGRWRPARACSWLADLRALRAYADHPLNAKLAVEGMLLSYAQSINET